MSNSLEEFLFLFGWNDFFESQCPVLGHRLRARVIGEERGLYRIQIDSRTTIPAQVSGRFQFTAAGRIDYPAVGDWVLVDLSPQAERATIQEIVPRRSVLRRRQAGTQGDTQILSTNVDTMFITTSINADLNLRRLERFLAVAYEAGSTPVILLTKADLCEELGENQGLGQRVFAIVEQVQREFPDVAVHAVSQTDFDSAIFFPGYVRPGTTSAFIGSSGVGKSTLVNYLIGAPAMKIQAIREDDEKGRHTTTSRGLFVSRFGGLVIDTPGMRELQLTDEHQSGVSTQFGDIETLVSGCRFGDCRHESEPDCEIQRALADTSLSLARWNSFLKLQREARHTERKTNKLTAAEDKKRWKKSGEAGRARMKMKRGGFDF